MSHDRNKKKAVFSWNISQTRRVQFEPGSKLGLVLGKDCTIARIRSNTQAFWKGVQVGSTILKVNGAPCESSSVKRILLETIKSGQSFKILFKVPIPPKTAKVEPVTVEHRSKGSKKRSMKISLPEIHKKTPQNTGSIVTSSTKKEPTSENQPAANDVPGVSQCTEEEWKSSDIAKLHDQIKLLEQANLELQQKCSEEVIIRKREGSKKDSKISRLERQVNMLQNERNMLRRQINKKKTSEKEAPSSGLKSIPEAAVASPSKNTFTFSKTLGDNHSKHFSTDESLQSVDVWYGNPTKDNMQAMWKESKKEAKQRSDSLASTAFGLALESPLVGDADVLDQSELYTEYTDSPRSTAYTEDTRGESFGDLADFGGNGQYPLSVFSSLDADASVIVLEKGG